MGKVLLLTLQAKHVEVDDSSSRYKHFVSPSLSKDLPIRSVPYSHEMSFIGSDDLETGRAMRRRGVKNMPLRFACDPAVESVICGPTLQENDDLRRRNAELKDQILRVREWMAFPWWRKAAYWMRGIGVLEFSGL